jgi:hypothetical protein
VADLHLTGGTASVVRDTFANASSAKSIARGPGRAQRLAALTRPPLILAGAVS